MKRVGNVFDKIVDIENLRLAHKNASKGKKHYSEVIEVERDLENKLLYIKDILENGKYELKLSDYRIEIIDDKGKLRELYKLSYFPHRIIQWAIMNIIMGDFISSFTRDTYASIPNRGIHNLLKKLKSDLRHNISETQYCLKIDITKFYPSIDNNILVDKLYRKFKDNRLLSLLKTIIFSMGNKGQPIGSLLSQYLANFYLSSFDHYCKEVLKLKFYYRYMDDIVVLHSNKTFLHTTLEQFKYLLFKESLNIKNNHQIFPTEVRGIDFVGYKFYHKKVLLRGKILRKALRVFRIGPHHKSHFQVTMGGVSTLI